MTLSPTTTIPVSVMPRMAPPLDFFTITAMIVGAALFCWLIATAGSGRGHWNRHD